MNSVNYDFYNNMFKLKYFKSEDLIEPVIVGLITKQEYEEITKEQFVIPQVLL